MSCNVSINGQLVKVVVPHGVLPGQTLQIQLPVAPMPVAQARPAMRPTQPQQKHSLSTQPTMGSLEANRKAQQREAQKNAREKLKQTREAAKPANMISGLQQKGEETAKKKQAAAQKKEQEAQQKQQAREAKHQHGKTSAPSTAPAVRGGRPLTTQHDAYGQPLPLWFLNMGI